MCKKEQPKLAQNSEVNQDPNAVLDSPHSN